MGRWCRFLAAGSCLALVCSGCATTQMRDTFGKLGSTARTETAQRAKARSPAAAREPELADDESRPRSSGGNPAQPGRRIPASLREKAEAEAAAASSGLALADLIQLELQDADPVERQELLESFVDLPDASVKRILAQRRRGLKLAGANGTSRSAGDARVEPNPAVRTVGAQQQARELPSQGRGGRTARDDEQGAAAQGLGTVSAWGQTTTAHRLATDADEADGPPTAPAAATASSPLPARAGSPDAAPEGLVHPEVLGEAAAHRGHSQGYGAPRARTSPSPVAAPAVPGQAKPAAARSNPLSGLLSAGAALIPTSAAAKAEGASEANAGAAVPSTGAALEAGVARTAANEAAGSGRPAELIKQLIAIAEAEVADLKPAGNELERQTYIERHVHLRMLYLVSGQQERALKAIPGIDPAEQEFWQETFWAMTNYFDVSAMPSSAERISQTVSQLTKAALRLQERANLELANVNFCHKISSFGNYDKYPRDEFNTGQEVLLYAEVANVRSEPGADGKFRSSLKSTLEILRHGADGEAIERIELPETVDFCRTHRRDYFHSYQFTIPPGLTAGPHVLKLTVEDQFSRRTATYSLNFTVK